MISFAGYLKKNTETKRSTAPALFPGFKGNKRLDHREIHRFQKNLNASRPFEHPSPSLDSGFWYRHGYY